MDPPYPAVTYTDLPTKDGDIDWDRIGPEYFDRIFSPLAPVMVTPDAGGTRRNPLIDDLLYDDDPLTTTRVVADLGCGPGNLLPFLVGRAGRVVGIDRSRGALDLAVQRARDLGVSFEPYAADFRDLHLDRRFDLVVAVCSILPATRAEVVPILEGVRRLLAPGGTFRAILSSYDTTRYLRALWLERLTPLHGQETASRMVTDFARAKLADDTDLLYADDGRTVQAYHTPESIETEYARAGLRLTQPLRKLHYPWALARRFDYGDFPDASEEIWDWYVVAQAG